MEDQYAGLENAGLENGGPIVQGWKMQERKMQDWKTCGTRNFRRHRQTTSCASGPARPSWMMVAIRCCSFCERPVIPSHTPTPSNLWTVTLQTPTTTKANRSSWITAVHARCVCRSARTGAVMHCSVLRVTAEIVTRMANGCPLCRVPIQMVIQLFN